MRFIFAVLVCSLFLMIKPTRAEDSENNAIVVKKQRISNKLSGGKWVITVSRYYRFGDSLDGRDRAIAHGRDTKYQFCLMETDVDDFVRTVVGEGPAKTSDTTLCRPLTIKMANGKVRARQICNGGNVTMDSGNGKVPKTYRTRTVLNISGSYSIDAIKLKFDQARELAAPPEEPATLAEAVKRKPDLTSWNVTGAKTGACEAEQPAP